jgi:hypothetical protein
MNKGKAKNKIESINANKDTVKRGKRNQKENTTKAILIIEKKIV